MYRKNTIIILILGFSLAFPVFSQPKKKIYITLDTSGSMYGDKYMISNYTAQLISLLCHYDDVYMICNGVPKKISGDVNSFKQIQFDYSLIRARWGVSPVGSQIGDIATFNNIFNSGYGNEQWLFIIGDGNWDSYKYPKITENFSSIVNSGTVKVFFIPYGNVNDGNSDFIDYLRTLKTPRILNGSRDLQSVISNCVIIFSYLTGNSGKNIQLSLQNSKSAKIISALPVSKYLLFYQDEADENAISMPVSAVQDSTNLKLNFLGTPTTSLLRYKDNQTLLSGTLWEISASKKIEADAPVVITFNKNINLKKLKLFPKYDLEINTNLNYLKSNASTASNLELSPIAFIKKDTLSKKHTSDSTKILTNKKAEKISKKETAVTLSETSETIVKLKKIKNKDSISIYTATVRIKEKIDTSKYKVEINHSNALIFKKISTKIDSNQITLTLESRGKWSQIFTPDTISLRAKLIPKKTAFSADENPPAKIYEIKAETTENGKHSHRNKNLAILAIVSFVLLVYFFMLTTKARFKKGAFIDYYNIYKIKKTILRKRGFAAWLNRWLNPFKTEKREIIFFDDQKSLVFYANSTKYTIRIPENSFDKKTMFYKEYAPNRHHFIELPENRELTIKSAEKEFIVLKYNSAPTVRDDRTFFRIGLWSISALIILLLILI